MAEAGDAAVMLNIQPIFASIQIFDPSTTSLTGCGGCELFEKYCMANTIAAEPAPVNGVVPHNQRRAIFLSHLGPRPYEIIRKTLLPALPNSRSIPQLIAILRDKYEPPGLVASNRYTFTGRNQRDTESVSEYIAAIQDLAAKCDFGNYLESALQDRLIAGIKYPEVRSKLLRTANLTYDGAKELVLQYESVRLQAQVLARTTNIHQVQTQCPFKHPNSYQKRPSKPTDAKHANPDHKSTVNQPQPQYGPCHRCGYRHDVKTCKAINWTCNIGVGKRVMLLRSAVPDPYQLILLKVFPNRRVRIFQRIPSMTKRHSYSISNSEIHDYNAACGGIGHFKDIHIEKPPSLEIQYGPVPCEKTDDSSYQEEFQVSGIQEQEAIYIKDMVGNPVSDSPPLYADVLIDFKLVKMEIDNGSDTSLMSFNDFQRLFPHIQLKACKVILRPVTTEISIQGECMTRVSFQGINYNLRLIVCKGTPEFTPLLGRSLLDILNPQWRHLLSLPEAQVNSIKNSSCPHSVNELKILFPAPFASNAHSSIQGFTAHLFLKDDVIPIFSRAYDVPYGLIDPVNKHLDQLLSADKIIPIRQSDWASPAVIVAKKDGGIRYCVDFKRTLNPSLRVDRYPLPKPEDVFATLGGGKVFTSLDLSDAYTQLKLNPHSQNLCVVNTHRGLFKYTRLIYGLASAASIFQNYLDSILTGIPGCVCYIDNILISGKSMPECVQRTLLVLARLEKRNVRLRLDKCEWFVPSIEYLGFVISEFGRRPTPNLHKDILEAPAPTDVHSLRFFLGLISFYSSLIPDFSTIANPLRKLTVKPI